MSRLFMTTVVGLGVALACACGSGAGRDRAPSDPADHSGAGPAAPGDLNERIARLEATAYNMEQQLQALDRKLTAVTADVGAVNGQLEQLDRRLEGMKAELARPAPRPRRPSAGRPDPAAVYSIPIAGSPFRGRKSAKVTMVRVFEFACPYCERSRPTMDQLMKAYPGDLRIVYKNLIVHRPLAVTPALAACAAHMQKQFFAMEEAIWERGYKANRDLGAAKMMRIARDLGLDMRKFERDMNGDRCRERVTDDEALVARVGARGTPSFFINGRFLSGARPIEQFRSLIDEELAKADRAIASGVAQSAYYETVVENGKKSLD